MSLLWLNNGFICKELYGPFVLGKDIEYKKDLSKKYSIVLNQAIKAGADEESISLHEWLQKRFQRRSVCLLLRRLF